MDERLSWMTSEQRETMVSRVNQAGRAVGIVFRGGGMVGRTREAHRVLRLVQDCGIDEGVRDAFVEGVFEVYHVLERDISSREVVREIAVDSGIDAVIVSEWLGSDVAGDVVDEEARRNKETGNPGVPRFVIQGEHRIEGASDPMEFVETFVKTKEEA